MAAAEPPPRPEPWFVAYALLGAAAAGLAPLLLPLWVSRDGNVALVGLVVGTLSLGELSAPLWGQLADKYGTYRLLFAGGLAVAGLSLTGLAFTRQPAALTLLSLALGAGIAATSTLGNLYVVERFPQDTWGERLGMLQTIYGVGQVAGLALAGLLSTTHLGLAIGLTAIVPFAALLYTNALPQMPGTVRVRPGHSHVHLKVEPIFASLLHAHHLPTIDTAIAWLRHAPPPFIRFQTLWFVINTGSAFLFAFYPLLLARQYGLPTTTIAWAYAAAAALGLLLYTPAGRWTERRGATVVLRFAITVRLVAFAALTVLPLAPGAWRAPAAMALFTVIVLAWSLLSVAGSTLTANLGLPEGEAMGLFSASGALAGVVGALLGGVLVNAFGYGILPLAATVFFLGGVLLTQRGGMRPPGAVKAAPGPTPPRGPSDDPRS